MMKSSTISISKGKGSLSHTDRTNSHSKSIDKSLLNENIFIVNRTIEEVYDELFAEALEKYNEKIDKAKHPERVKKNYLEEIQRSKQEKPFYEFIFEFGNTKKYEHGSADDLEFQKILLEYANEFEHRNPNFKVIKSVIHNDEPLSLGHLHIDIVPFSTGNKRGLETKNSISGALKEMGYGRNGFSQWRVTELEHLKSKLLEHGYDFETGTGRDKHFNTDEFKEYTQQIERHEKQLNDINSEISYQKRINANYKAEKKQLEENISKIKLEQQVALKAMEKVKIELDQEKKELQRVKNEVQEQQNMLYELQKRYVTLKEKISCLIESLKPIERLRSIMRTIERFKEDFEDKIWDIKRNYSLTDEEENDLKLFVDGMQSKEDLTQAIQITDDWDIEM